MRTLPEVVQEVLSVWAYRGCQNADGLFVEEMSPVEGIRPVAPTFQRLVVQARQVFSYTEGCSIWGSSDGWADLAHSGWEGLLQHYAVPADRDGLRRWRYALGEGAPQPSEQLDLYGHAFVVLAASSYARVFGSEEALDVAESTLKFVTQNFRKPAGGFVAQLQPDLSPQSGPLLQNPHMHLLEATLNLLEVRDHSDFRRLASELIDLFASSMSRGNSGNRRRVYEEFDDGWTPKPGQAIEPGHHYEWAWLLGWAAKLECLESSLGNPCSDLSEWKDGLIRWALDFGWDQSHDMVIDFVDPETGRDVAGTRRLWPQLEAQKALTLSSGGDAEFSIYCQARRVALESSLATHFFSEAPGGWVERHDQELHSVGASCPASSLYHMVMACREMQRHADLNETCE